MLDTEKVETAIKQLVENTPAEFYHQHPLVEAAIQRLVEQARAGYAREVLQGLVAAFGRAIVEGKYDPRNDPYHPDNWADPREI